MKGMLPTIRAARLMALCALLALGGLLVPEAAWVGAAAFVALLVACVVDWMQIPDPSQAEWKRECPDTMSVGTRYTIRLTARWYDNQPVSVLVRDELPQRWRMVMNPVAAELSPDHEAGASYTIVPPKRGNADFTSLSLRYVGPRGLMMRQHEEPLSGTVRVLPNYEAVARYDLLTLTGKLPHAGVRPTPKRGRGTEFESLRTYQPDDDFRTINWKATARRGELVTAVYQVERSQSVLIALDAGRLMGAGVDGRSKLDWAMDTALLLAHVAGKQGDKVGVCAFSERVLTYLPPTGGKDIVRKVAETVYDIEPSHQDSDYAAAFTYMRTRGLTRSLVVCLSDVTEEGAGGDLPRSMASLSPKHVPCLILLSDPEITDIAHSMPDTPEHALRKAAAGQVLSDRKRALQAVTSSGGLALDIPPTQLTVSAVNAYLDVKRRGRL